jgi:molecular chaperone DnaJ
VIEEEINAAGRVVVLWSKTSVDSTWVLDEANLAKELGKLVPVAIDDCAAPLGFRYLHTLRGSAVDTIADDLLIACGSVPRPKSETPRAAEPIEPNASRTAEREPPPAEGAAGAQGGDAARSAGASEVASGSSDFGDIFGEFFGLKPGAVAGRRGSDLRYNYSLSLEEAFRGKVVEIAVPALRSCEICSGSGAKAGAASSKCTTCDGSGEVKEQQGFFRVQKKCPTCNGQGGSIADVCEACGGEGRVTLDRRLSVNIPAGVESGTRIRLAGEGEAGFRGGEAGDLYIVLEVTPHEFFQRSGDDLTCRVPVPVTLAALGGPVEIPSVDGGPLRVRVPPGMQSNQSLRLRGRGMSRLRGEGRGDLFVRSEVETPQGLGPHAREVVGKLRDLRPTAARVNANLAAEERGPDLSCEVVVSIFDAALGGEVTFSIEGGPMLRLKVPEGVQNGQLMRLRGLGREGGDLYVTVRTELPAGLTDRERGLLEELQNLGSEVTHTESRSFMERVRELFAFRPEGC